MYILDELEPQEDFIGLYKMDNICASDIRVVRCIKDSLVHINLLLPNCHGQCYNGDRT